LSSVILTFIDLAFYLKGQNAESIKISKSKGSMDSSVTALNGYEAWTAQSLR